VAAVGEGHVQVAVAVQVAQAGGVVIRTAAIDSAREVVGVTAPSQQQEQKYNLQQPSEQTGWGSPINLLISRHPGFPYS